MKKTNIRPKSNIRGISSKRPISPFLTIYRLQMTSLFSILERITGIILVGVVILVYVTLKIELIGISYYGIYTMTYVLYKGMNGIVMGGILFIILNFYYHVIFGIRYLFWDKTGGKDEYKMSGIDLKEIYKSNIIMVGLTVGLTVITWLIILMK